jgi:hypothetical protein
MLSTQRTLPVTWLVRVARISSGVETGRASKLQMTGTRGLWIGAAARARASLSCADSHQAAVISAGHGQGDGAFDALVLRFGGGGRDAFSAAAEDDLAGGVQVRDIDVAFGGEFANRGFLTAEHGQHRALGVLAGFFHEAAALEDEVEAGGEVEGARGGMGGEFAEGETRRGGDVERRDLFP